MTLSPTTEKQVHIPLICELDIIQGDVKQASSSNAPSIPHDGSIFDCCKTMLLHESSDIQVTKNGEIIGLIRFQDALKAAFHSLDLIQQSLLLAATSEQRARTIEASLHIEIRHHIEILMAAAHRGLKGEPQKSLEQISEVAQSINEILNTFDTITRLATSVQTRSEGVELNSFLAQLVSATQTNAKVRGMAISFSPSSNIQVPFQKKSTAQALRAVVEDMIRSYGPGAVIRIETFYRAKARAADAHIRISVQNPNSSMNREQCDASTILVSGIAYMLLRETIYQQGGQFHVDVESESAMTFNISLPNAEEIQNTDRLFDAPTVLVVEDDSDVLTLLADIVRGRGYRVLLAHDGQQALDLFKAERPTLVFADVRMPRLDGIGLADAIKAIDDTTPIILFSGQYPNLMEDRLEKKIKADHVLYKPFATADVIESISLFLPSVS